jgi:hypothetical protein
MEAYLLQAKEVNARIHTRGRHHIGLSLSGHATERQALFQALFQGGAVRRDFELERKKLVAL